MNTSKSRRDFLKTGGAALAAVGALGAGTLAAPAHAAGSPSNSTTANGKPKHDLNLRTDGTYATAKLAKPGFMLGVVQDRVRAVDASKGHAGLRDNLNHMLDLIDKAFYFGSKPDWLLFHEFPITGWDNWTRDEILKFAIEVPGPETEEISKKAKQYGCYITFGSYAKDADWPGHVLSLTTTIAPDGSIAARDWKAHNIDMSSFFPGAQLFTTTVYSVLDRYVEMYGRDAVVPIHRTSLCNFTASSAQYEPNLFQTMALKGAEVILRTATGGFSPIDVQACAMYNRVYVGLANNALSPDDPHFFPDVGAGGSAIYGPDGKAMGNVHSEAEQLVVAYLPIAEFRARHRQEQIPMDLYRDVYDNYRSAYPPNLFSKYDPTSVEDSARYLKTKSRWK